MSNKSHKRDGFASLESLGLTTATDASLSCDPPTQDGVDVELAPAPAIATEPFDYAALAPELAEFARDAAEGIRRRTRLFIAEIGRDLIAIKEKLPHGLFGAWIRAELGMSDRSARNYMNFARFIEGKSEKIAHLPATIIYELASPSAPREKVKEIIAAVDADVVMSLESVRTKLATPIGAKKQPEQVADVFIPEEQEGRRLERLAAQRRVRKANRDLKERERIGQLPPFAQRLGHGMEPEDLAGLIDLLTRGRRERIAMRRQLEAEIQPVLI